MVEKTHVLGGMAMGIGGYLYLEQAGFTITGVNEALQLGIILPYAIWSSVVPDLDQDNDDVAFRNPINLAIQKFFNLIGAGHRSFKSHIAPMLVALFLYLSVLSGAHLSYFNTVEMVILSLISLGIFLGLFSHFLLDIMTESGVRIGEFHIRIVPPISTFGSGTPYELFVRRILYVIVIVLLVVVFTK